MTTIYTAVGRFQKRQGAGGLSCPIITVGQREYGVDLQEMILWTILNWRILKAEQLEGLYQEKCLEVNYQANRPFDGCLRRLLQRGLVVSGSGQTDEDALYHLLSCLYIVPISQGIPLRAATFLKLMLSGKATFAQARRLFKKNTLSDCERRVMELSKQALLSTAEVIKCVEKDAYDLSSSTKIMDILYGDNETTSDNIASIARCFESRQPVILAVANLYLRQQIIFERGDLA